MPGLHRAPAPRRLAALTALLALAGCEPWTNWPYNGWADLDGELWDTDVVNAVDGTYVRLPHAGRLVRVSDDGSFAGVDLDGAEPVRLVPTPDESTVLVFATWASCDDPDEDIVYAADCDDDDLELNSELAVVVDGVRTDVLDVPAHMNRISFSPDGNTAVAYLEYEEGMELQTGPVADFTEVQFLPLDGGAARAVPIGIEPSNILFTPDNERAVVMSRSEVVVVDLEDFEVTVTYPLTLDADQEVDPRDAVLTPDGRYALVSVDGSSELYKLDLVNPNIDIEDLDAPPTDLVVAEDEEVVVIVYNQLSRVDVLDLDTFELKDPVALDDPMNSVLLSDGRALLYNDQSTSHDVYALDLNTTELVEYRVENPVDAMRLSPSGRYAVGVLAPEGSSGGGVEGFQDANWGLSVVDLEEDEAVSLVLSAEPVGLEIVEQDGNVYALLLLENLDTLLQLDLTEPSIPVEIELDAPPRGIGALPDGRFSITHDAPLGLITFLDPTKTGDDATTTAAGFATLDLMADHPLPRRDADSGEEN
jgi:hypothetical protein